MKQEDLKAFTREELEKIFVDLINDMESTGKDNMEYYNNSNDKMYDIDKYYGASVLLSRVNRIKNMISLKNYKDMTCTGYVIRFNEPDMENNIYTKESINLDNFKQMKLNGHIIDYEIDDIGVKIITKLNLSSIDMNINDIRNLVITGTYMIGPDGEEPAHGWKDYVDALEKILIENNGVLPIKNNSISINNKKNDIYEFKAIFVVNDYGEAFVIKTEPNIFDADRHIFDDTNLNDNLTNKKNLPKEFGLYSGDIKFQSFSHITDEEIEYDTDIWIDNVEKLDMVKGLNDFLEDVITLSNTQKEIFENNNLKIAAMGSEAMRHAYQNVKIYVDKYQIK